MKQYNCPDCHLFTDSCDGCPRVKDFSSNIYQEKTYDDVLGKYLSWTYVPDCCRTCSNHPSNGGSGICNCTLPYMDKSAPFTPTWITTSSSCKILTTEDDYGNIITIVNEE